MSLSLWIVLSRHHKQMLLEQLSTEEIVFTNHGQYVLWIIQRHYEWLLLNFFCAIFQCCDKTQFPSIVLEWRQKSQIHGK